MMEPKIDAEEVERLFRTPEVSPTDGATLYDDLIIRRGRSRYQLVSIYDSDRSKRIVACMRCLRATLTEVIATVSSLDTSQINQDGLAELLELMASVQDIEKILYHVRKKGAGQLDHPEYLVFELSKVDHFRDRLEFLRFRYKMQWHLFEIEQQLRELHTACDEIMNSISLKNLLETLLSIGNYLNGGTDMGQADGYHLDVLNRLKETHDRDGRGTLLEFVLKTYCQVYENEVDIGCPTRFRLPEPSNMRHAAQVSFESIQDALSNLHADLRHVREKLLDPKVNKNTTRPMDSFRVMAENFFAAALEVIGEQEKVLQDTRDFFDKTVAYFAIETTVTPQQFFQIWAVFLHDCKYFWKLAHRRLAKERFELEFKYKGQMSSCSLHGYGSFRAGVMKGLTGDKEINTSTQLRHVDNWVNNLDNTTVPAVPPKPHHEDTHDGRAVQDSGPRSPSPKPLTCTPPLSEGIHKPQPKAPAASNSSQPVPNGSVPMSPNYENQSEYDRQIPKSSFSNQNIRTPQLQVETRTPMTGSEHSKKSQQFSLKAWLKREREQVRRDVENDTVTANNEAKQSPARSFTKLKTSMFQKFGTSNKKQTETPKKHKDSSKKFTTPPVKPARQNHVQEISAPFGVVRKEIISENNVLTTRDFPPEAMPHDNIQREYHSETSNPEPVISPIEDNEVENDNHNPTETSYNPYSYKTREMFGIHESDMNNNESFKLNTDVPRLTEVSERVPMQTKTELGQSPKGLPSDAQGSYLQDSEFPSPVSHQLEESLVTPDPERILAQKIPVYKAKIINNYENQGKFEVVHAVRQQAEPLKPRDKTYEKFSTFKGQEWANTEKQVQSPYSHDDQTPSPSTQSSPFTTPQKYVKNNPTPPSHRLQSSYRGSSRQNIERKRDIGKHGHVRNEHETPYSSVRNRVKDMPRYAARGNRESETTPSIGTLIDRFDRQNNNADKTPSRDPHSAVQTNAVKDQMTPKLTMTPQPLTMTPKPLTMTSTPVAHRREFSGNLEEINETSPPLPPRSDKSKRKQKSNDETLEISSRNNSYRPPDLSSSATQPPYHGSVTQQSVQSPNHPHHFYSPNAYNSPQSKASVPNNFSPLTYNDGKQNDIDSSPLTYNYGKQVEMDNANILNNNTVSVKPYTPSGRLGVINDNERDDSYSFQLRRAANNSAFDRYGPVKSPYQGRAGPSHPHSPDSIAVVRPNTDEEEGISYMEI